MPETKWYSYLFSGISGLGIITNFKSFKYITRTFQTTDDLFSILAKDSLISTLCSGLYFITNTIRIIIPEYLKNKPGCIVQFLGIYIPGVIGPVISSYISLHRYVALKNQKQISYPGWAGKQGHHVGDALPLDHYFPLHLHWDEEFWLHRGLLRQPWSGNPLCQISDSSEIFGDCPIINPAVSNHNSGHLQL